MQSSLLAAEIFLPVFRPVSACIHFFTSSPFLKIKCLSILRVPVLLFFLAFILAVIIIFRPNALFQFLPQSLILTAEFFHFILFRQPGKKEEFGPVHACLDSTMQMVSILKSIYVFVESRFDSLKRTL
jgi:hypothetical protein